MTSVADVSPGAVLRKALHQRQTIIDAGQGGIAISCLY